jgi:Methyltransferase domain
MTTASISSDTVAFSSSSLPGTRTRSALLKRVHDSLRDRFGIEVAFRRKRPHWPDRGERPSYQERYVDSAIRPGDHVLDIGCGGYPFPPATVLVDRFLATSPTRHESLVTDDKPFVLADIHALPFRDKSFDYVYCAHVLEVIDDPLSACQEIMRVGTRGFIEAPTAAKDTLFAWARGLQKWHIVAIGQSLCFFEYSDRELDGIRSTVWRDLVFSRRQNPIQEAFYTNQDAFNVMFTWNDAFSVWLFRLDGTVRTFNLDSRMLLNEITHERSRLNVELAHMRAEIERLQDERLRTLAVSPHD